MAIDPSLITDTLSRWQSPQFAFPDPLAQYAKLQALKNGIMEQQVNQQRLQSGALDLQQKEDLITGNQALRKAIQQSIQPGQNGTPPQVDHNNVIQLLGQGGHGDLIDSYMQGVATREKSKADLAKVENENQQSTVDTATRIFSNAKDQAGWDQGIAYLHGHGADPNQLGIPPVYTPDAQAKVVQLGMSVKDQLAQNSSAQTSQAKADEVGVAKSRLQREKDQDFINSVGSAQSQEDYAAKLAQARVSGVSPSLISSAPAAFSPAAAQQFSQQTLTSKDRADIAARQATATGEAAGRTETARHNRVQESIEATRNQLTQAAARGDRSYQSATHELDQIGKPITDAVARLGKLQDTLAQNSPQADALVAPELLSVMAGGAGSGLRMNESEIARVIGGRSKWQDLQAAVNKWQLDPTKANSITPEQRSQIRTLTQAVSDKLYAKQNALNDAYKTVAGSQDPNDHRQAVLSVRQAIANVDSGGGTPSPAAGAAPPFPSKLSQSDVGKTYTNRNNQRVRITAVNPANPAQFQSTVVP